MDVIQIIISEECFIENYIATCKCPKGKQGANCATRNCVDNNQCGANGIL